MELTHIPHIPAMQSTIDEITEKYINGEMGYEELKTALNKLDLSADEYLELLTDICNRLKEG